LNKHPDSAELIPLALPRGELGGCFYYIKEKPLLKTNPTLIFSYPCYNISLICMNKKALLHLFNEFLPVLGFFVAMQFFDFFTATSVLMSLTIIALLAGWYFERHLPVLPIISGVFVLIGGSITNVYKAPDALIFADSLYYFMMGLGIATGFIFKVNILKLIFARVFAMKDIGWKILAIRWVVIFLLGGIANEVVRQLATPEDWADFKVLKVITIAIFGFYQFTLSRKYRIPEISTEWGLHK
jgi:intracellular septation protein